MLTVTLRNDVHPLPKVDRQAELTLAPFVTHYMKMTRQDITNVPGKERTLSC